MSTNNNYNTGAPSTDYTQPPASASTRIASHIPGTQAYREREYLEHENRATLHGTGHSTVPPTSVNTGAQAPVYNNNVPPSGGTTMPANLGPGGVAAGGRVGELQGHRAHHPGAAAPITGNAASTTTKPHMGDKVLGGAEVAVGRMTNNPVMEQKGWERKTFGDPKHRQGGLAGGGVAQQGFGPTGTAAQQGLGPTGTAHQQGYTHPQPGYGSTTYPPAGY